MNIAKTCTHRENRTAFHSNLEQKDLQFSRYVAVLAKYMRILTIRMPIILEIYMPITRQHDSDYQRYKRHINHPRLQLANAINAYRNLIYTTPRENAEINCLIGKLSVFSNDKLTTCQLINHTDAFLALKLISWSWLISWFLLDSNRGTIISHE